jgi:NTE family protein
MRTGLVLGGGGLVGQAYHAGVLAALENDGWDAREADVIVGTSAGAVTGALLRSGVAPSEMAGAVAKTGGTNAQLLGVQHESIVFEPLTVRAMLRFRWPTPALLSRVARGPWMRRPFSALSNLLPDGNLDVVGALTGLEPWIGSAWPEQGDLRITAVRHDNARRVVFSARNSTPPPLATAVAASCAVPGYFQPVAIGGRTYVDGGAYSPTNADVLIGDDLDVVVVVAPLSTSVDPGWALDGWIRRLAAHLLRTEVAALERAGTDVVVMHPGADSTAAMGADLMQPSVCLSTLQEGFFDVGRRSRRVDRRLRGLSPARRAA